MVIVVCCCCMENPLSRLNVGCCISSLFWLLQCFDLVIEVVLQLVFFLELLLQLSTISRYKLIIDIHLILLTYNQWWLVDCCG